MTQILFKDLASLKGNYKEKKIVFCSGSFDLTHVGHALFFEDCKKLGDILVVGIAGDRILKKLKGEKRPILNQYTRTKMVDFLKPVDYTFLDDFTYKHKNPLSLVEMVFRNLKPDKYVINEDAFNIQYRQELCKKYDVELNILKRNCPDNFEKISTTKIIEKIKSLDKI